MSSNYSPYSGDVFHEVLLLLQTDYYIQIPVYAVSLQQPLVLTVFQWLTSLGEWAVGAFFIVSETSLYIPEHRSHSALYSITAECGCGDSSVSGWYSRSPFEGPGEMVLSYGL